MRWWRVYFEPATSGNNGAITVYRILESFGNPAILDSGSWEVSITLGDSADFQAVNNLTGRKLTGLANTGPYYMRIRPAGSSGMGQYIMAFLEAGEIPSYALVDYEDGEGLVGYGGGGIAQPVVPDWFPVSPYQYRCVQSNGNNTGEQEQLMWNRRPDSSTYMDQQWMSIGQNLVACPLPPPVNTGMKAWTTLEEYYTDDNSATGVTKPNTPGDPHYAAPVSDPGSCPIGQP